MDRIPCGAPNGFMLATVLSNDSQKGVLKIRLMNEGCVPNVLENVKVLAPYAGKDYGGYLLPEVGEQVVVGFLGGALDRPFVLGSLYPSADPMLSQSAKPQNAWKRLRTKAGNEIRISDEKGDEQIQIQTPEQLSIRLSQKEQSIRLDAGETRLCLNSKDGSLTLSASESIRLETGTAKLTMKSNGDIILTGGVIRLRGQKLSGQASGLLELKGVTGSLEGKSSLNLSSSGPVSVKGSLIKLN